MIYNLVIARRGANESIYNIINQTIFNCKILDSRLLRICYTDS
ncbi:hypothetical protein [Helicobacter muridarum]|nr:hypothetical protein [Helicobacter muridarum]